jgi:hypothetical protein
MVAPLVLEVVNMVIFEPMMSSSPWLKWKLISVSFEVVLISTQDRCIDCDECVTGLEIILGAPDGTSR